MWMRRSRVRRTSIESSTEPDSLPAFLAWLGKQCWSVWIKITLFVVIIAAVIGQAGGRVVSEFLAVFH